MIDDKPKSMSLSNFFIKKTAIKTLISESIVELVIKDQWKGLNQAIKSHKYFDHEISAFGYFKLAPVKLGSQLNRYTKLLNSLIHKKERAEGEGKTNIARVSEIKVQSIEKVLENLIAKKETYESRLEGTVKWDSEPIYRGAMDKRRSQRENGDLQNLPIQFESGEPTGEILQ